MPRTRRTAKTHRPYLSSSEFMDIADVSRKALRGYEASGICTPAYVDESGYYKYWTLDQAIDLRLVQALRHGDLSLKEVAGLFDGEGDALLDAAYRQTADDIRDTRRMLKAIVHRKRQLADFAPARNMKGFYLRYVPLRWMALAPTAIHEASPPSSDEFVRLFSELKGVAEVVGWSQTLAFGSLLSIDADGRSASRYVYVELASPPMPVITGSRVVDGGCYHVVDGPDDVRSTCDGRSCFDCARFGRTPEARETRTWDAAARQRPDLWSRTVMLDDLDEPFPSGMWSDLTARLIAARSDDGQRREPEIGNPGGGLNGPTLRPRLMPHLSKLPLGVSACVLPAGFYLCRQHSDIDGTDAVRTLLDAADALERRPFTLEQERTAARSMERERWERRPAPQAGPFVEPFAAPRGEGDPAFAGWCRDLDENDLAQLVLPTRMALAPEDGFCVVSARVPIPKASDSIRHELQMLVNAENMATPPL